MAKQEAKVADAFLPKESQPSEPPYYYIRVPIIEEESPYLIIPLCPTNPRLRKCFSCKCYCTNLILLLALLFLIALGLIFWHSQPQIRVTHVEFDHLNMSRSNGTTILHDTSMDLQLSVQGKAFVPHQHCCSSVSVLVGNGGRLLATTLTNLTTVNSRSMSFLDAVVKVNESQALQASVEHHGDNRMKPGEVPIDLLVEIKQELNFFSVRLPVQARVCCSVTLDVESQKMVDQDCYPPPADDFVAQE